MVQCMGCAHKLAGAAAAATDLRSRSSESGASISVQQLRFAAAAAAITTTPTPTLYVAQRVRLPSCQAVVMHFLASDAIALAAALPVLLLDCRRVGHWPVSGRQRQFSTSALLV